MSAPLWMSPRLKVEPWVGDVVLARTDRRLERTGGAGTRSVGHEAALGTPLDDPADAHPANLGTTVGDRPDRVEQRRQALSGRLAMPTVWLDAVHGAKVIDTDADLREPAGPALARTLAPGDAAVTTSEGLALVALSADCIPIAFADPTAGVIAIAHAGWRGTASDIVRIVVEAMVRQGAHPDRLHVHLGAAVCGNCYPVGTEVFAALAATDPHATAAATVPLTGAAPTRAGGAGIDLRQYLTIRALRAGVAASRITRSSRCTVEDQNVFSHRRDGGGPSRGRQALFVMRASGGSAGGRR